MTLAPDTRLGPYSIISLLGVGGMGEVYAAVDTRLNRKVAIKMLPAHVAGDPEFRKRLEREAKSISSLNHPYICTLYDIGAQDGIDFLVLEYLEGTTLADRLAHEPLSLEEALRYGIQMAAALDAAHERGIVHRDFKPGNVTITRDGIVKLLDFGIAKVVGVDRHGLAVGAAGLPVDARQHDQAMHRLQAAALSQELAGQPVEQLGMRGRTPRETEVTRRAHDSLAKVILPDPIDHDASRERILGMAQPACQGHTTFRLRRVFGDGQGRAKRGDRGIGTCDTDANG